MAVPIDPFTLLFDAAQTLLLSNKAFAQLVRPRDRQWLDTQNSKSPEDIAASIADRPAIMLFPDGFNPALETTSSSSRFDVQFYVLALTGSPNPRGQAMLTWWEHFKTLTWEGHEFVTDVSLGRVTSNLVDDQSSAFYGWTSRLDFSVTCHFRTSTM
jgi:hypothetical protein